MAKTRRSSGVLRRLPVGATAWVGCCALVGAVQAAPAAPPPPVDFAIGSPERTELLDLLRRPVERELGLAVKFKVLRLRAVGDIALAEVTPLHASGTPLGVEQTKLREEADHLDGLHTEGIFRKVGGRWRLIEHGVGATDVWFADYCDKRPRLCS